MPPKKIGTFEEIQAAKDLAEGTVVDIPEWGFAVKIRGLTRGELIALNALADNGNDPDETNIQAAHLALTEPKLTLEQVRDIYRDKSIRATERITNAVLEASGMTDGFRPGEGN